MHERRLPRYVFISFSVFPLKLSETHPVKLLVEKKKLILIRREEELWDEFILRVFRGVIRKKNNFFWKILHLRCLTGF